jgi:hypothetical protein
MREFVSRVELNGHPVIRFNGGDDMDTKYFAQAVEEWCKKHKWDKDLPMTPSWLSEMLQRAQVLKDADRRTVEEGAAS